MVLAKESYELRMRLAVWEAILTQPEQAQLIERRRGLGRVRLVHTHLPKFTPYWVIGSLPKVPT